MKPTLSGMDEKSANVTVVMQPTQNELAPSKRSNKRLLIGIVSGITLVLIIVAAILMAVFLGAKVTKDSQKEAWLNYQDKNGEKKSEHVVATDREEDYTVPNEMRVIYDFEKGYAIYKIEKSSSDNDDADYSVCYVSHLNRTNLANPQQVKDRMTDSEIDVPSNTETEEIEYVSTGQGLPRDLLSPRAREMCKDSKVIWMAKRTDSSDQQREKRGTCTRYICYYRIYKIGSRYYIRYWCVRIRYNC